MGMEVKFTASPGRLMRRSLGESPRRARGQRTPTPRCPPNRRAPSAALLQEWRHLRPGQLLRMPRPLHRPLLRARPEAEVCACGSRLRVGRGENRGLTLRRGAGAGGGRRGRGWGRGVGSGWAQALNTRGVWRGVEGRGHEGRGAGRGGAGRRGERTRRAGRGGAWAWIAHARRPR